MTTDEADRTWGSLAGYIEQLINEWEGSESAPRLEDFLPDDSRRLRRMTLIELVKVDLEYRWQHRGLPKLVEAYADEFCELAQDGGVPCDLIYEEFHVRRLAGETVDTQEYLDRFPDRADELSKLLAVDTKTESTSLYFRAPADDVDVGDRLDDFDLLARLGTGSFGSVFLARQNAMQRLVALKVSSDRGSEPQTLAQLDHPHIVRVYDQRLLPDRKLRLMYMQYIAGGTLQDVIRVMREVPLEERSGKALLAALDRLLEDRGESPPTDAAQRRKLRDASWPEVVCRIGAQLAAALAYAQRQGVLHRDVKPANVLLAADATPKLADFNISFSSQVAGATPSAYFGGSLAYMSPEQLEASDPTHLRRPDELDGRTDIYSLGVLLWEVLHGERPFDDVPDPSDWAQTLRRMIDLRRAGTPPLGGSEDRDPRLVQLERVLLRCLEPDSQDRWPSGDELARQLYLCLQPHAQRLLKVPTRGWRWWVLRLPLPSLLVAGILPNVLAALFNLAYNLQQIVSQLPDSQDVFWRIQSTINIIAFPIGIGLFVLLAWPVFKAVSALAARRHVPAEQRASARLRALRLGHYIAMISLVEWIVAGIAYPVTIHALMSALPFSTFLHFFASLTLCGTIVLAYSFYPTTFLGVRVFYPLLLGREQAVDDEPRHLERVVKLCGGYLLVAGTVPMLAVMLLVFSGMGSKFALGILSTVSFGGFGLVYLAYRLLQRDLEALTSAVKPIEADEA